MKTRMKIKAAASVKGKIFLSGHHAELRAGDEIEIDQSLFNGLQIQTLLRNGMLESKDYKKSSLVEYKNLTKCKVCLPNGTCANPFQIFEADKQMQENSIFQSLIQSKLIEKFVRESPKEPEKKVEPKKEAVKEKKPNKTQDKKVPVSVKEIMENQKVPEGMHIHDPTKSKDKEKNIFIEETISQIEKDEEDGMVFADKKQLKEKLQKLHKTVEDKQEK